MSGLEPLAGVAAKAGTPAAGRIAAAVGMKLAKSRTIRWRVRRRASKAVDFDVPRRPFAAWLKQIDVATLSEAVESAGPRLAQSLDSRLSGDAAWRASTDRHSRALILVKNTYLAMEALSEVADARTLSSSWAEARHREMLDLLAHLVGPEVRLSRSDLADILESQSEARREVRLASFGISPVEVGAELATFQSQVPSVDPGKAITLVGPFGSGKSELAELWFINAVDEYRRDMAARRPMWIHASELTSRSLDDEITRRCGASRGSPARLAVVIDGLDEIDATSAARIVAQSQALVRVGPNTSVLMTCRPGVLPSDESQVHHDGLNRTDAVALIETIASSVRATWSWDPTLIDAITRPFFALAAGIMIRDGERPASQADLIERLVTRALSTHSGSSRAVQDQSTFDLLAVLAVSATTSGGADDGLTFQQRRQALTSTLVHEVSGRVEFSLPIFQQWFASTEVLKQPSLVDLAMSDGESFDRWRWALAVACLSASPDQLDDILTTCLGANPGAGAWILSQVAAGHQWYREDDGDDIDASTAGHRLLRATRTWIDSLGDLSTSIFPIDNPSQRIGLGVHVSGKRVSTGWLRAAPEADTLLDLPTHVHPLAPLDDAWWPDRTGGVAEGDEWPWVLGRKRIAGSLLKVLDTNPLIGGTGGVWQGESRYRALRIVLNARSMLYPPIDRDEALRTIEEKLDVFPSGEVAAWTLAGSGTIEGREMVDLVDWLRAHPQSTIVRPLPLPDRQQPSGGMIWDFYSDDRLKSFCAEMLGNGCEAYDEAATGLFSRFGWSLGTGDPGSFGVLAELAFQSDGPRGRMPVINKMVLPLDVLSDEIDSWGSEFEWSRNGRAAVAYASDASQSDLRFHERSQALFDRIGPRLTGGGPFRRGPGWSGSILDQVHHPRPASLTAAKWLWSDLKALHLADGTFPQLRN
ncbi:NACHT domain-containing protein [Propionibacteriaceae bacterium Y1700]|uniref:NACHT domain-containing protein n=1 Tax=Microlunatus sp. Y1700 TaxID=3418487 RepID=UPI003DA73E20